jgi:hypothetical protein
MEPRRTLYIPLLSLLVQQDLVNSALPVTYCVSDLLSRVQEVQLNETGSLCLPGLLDLKNHR